MTLRKRLPGPARFFQELSGSMIRSRLYRFSRLRRPAADYRPRADFYAWMYDEGLR